MELGNRDDEQVTVRHTDASDGDIRENQHEEDRMRDIHIDKRGSEAAVEEQPDKLKKTVRFEQEASRASASSDPIVPLEYPASGETQSRLGPYLCRSQVMLMTTYKFPRWMHSTRWMDERVVTSEKCWNGIEEDARDVKRIESNQLVENLTCLNAREGKIWKSDQKVVMDEALVQNGAADQELVQNGAMDVKIDPKVVVDLSIFKIGGWNSLNSTNQNLLEESIVKNES